MAIAPPQHSPWHRPGPSVPETAGRSPVEAVPELVVAMDYTGTCRGTCPTCVLSLAERRSEAPLMTVASIEAGLARVAGAYPHVGSLFLTLGRGNTLVLPETSIDALIAVAQAAEAAVDYRHAAMEMSTSLVGRLEPQIDRAKAIMDRFQASGTDVDPRFLVVANTALSSAPYWRNIDRFLTEIEAYRGGRSVDGNGDIILLNVGIDSLPDVGWLEQFLCDYRFPVNLGWVPTFDQAAGDPNKLQVLARWLADFDAMAERLGLDANITNRAGPAMTNGAAGLDSLVHQIDRSIASIVYITADGHWHRGFNTLLADMDPVRFDPDAPRVAGQAQMVDNPRRDIARLMRNPACRACPHMGPCIAGGAYKLGLLTLRRHPGGTDVCPSAMNLVFERRSHA